jgi:hypothetical protein
LIDYRMTRSATFITHYHRPAKTPPTATMGFLVQSPLGHKPFAHIQAWRNGRLQRLLEQRRRGELDAPLSLADAEAASRAVIHDARGALAEGRRVFLCRIPAMYDQPIAVGTAGLRGPSSVIESIENLGWRLDQMSWVPHAGRRAEGYFLFRRHDGPLGG